MILYLYPVFEKCPFSALQCSLCQRLSGCSSIRLQPSPEEEWALCCALTTAQSEPLKCPIHHLLRDRHTVFFGDFPTEILGHVWKVNFTSICLLLCLPPTIIWFVPVWWAPFDTPQASQLVCFCSPYFSVWVIYWHFLWNSHENAVYFFVYKLRSLLSLESEKLQNWPILFWIMFYVYTRYVFQIYLRGVPILLPMKTKWQQLFLTKTMTIKCGIFYEDWHFFNDTINTCMYHTYAIYYNIRVLLK